MPDTCPDRRERPKPRASREFADRSWNRYGADGSSRACVPDSPPDHQGEIADHRLKLIAGVIVHKPASPTLPRRPAGASGGELSHPAAPSKERRSPSTGTRSDAVCSPEGAPHVRLTARP